MSYEEQPLDEPRHEEAYPAAGTALDKVRLPAIFLIIVGILNIPGGFFWALTGANAMWNVEANEQAAKQFNLPKVDPGQAKVGAIFYFGLCVMSLVAGAITILGGVRMLSLKSYGLAILGSVLAILPCISVMGCCGVGEGVGIWSLIVLTSADVRSAFR
jgi:hypothetical protein